MKLCKPAILVLLVLTLMSCGGGVSKQPATADGFAAIEADLKSQFGADAYYTDIFISPDDSVGNIITLTVTDAPETLKMGQWTSMQDSWTQSSEVTLEIPNGTKATEFMFQLSDKINLEKVGELIEKSAKQLSEEKNLKDPKLSSASVKFPKDGDMSKMEYSINMKPENGGTTFSFYYTLNGDLIKMDY